MREYFSRVGQSLKSLAPLVLIPLVPFLMNVYQHHNVDYVTEGKRVLKKMDGIMAFTEVEVHNDGEIRMVRSAFPSRYSSYIDTDGDHRLNTIYLSGNIFGRGSESENRYLTREKDLVNNRSIFSGSERAFTEELSIFGLL